MLVPRRQTKWPCSCCTNAVTNHLTPTLPNHPRYIINKYIMNKTTVISTQSCAVSTNVCSVQATVKIENLRWRLITGIRTGLVKHNDKNSIDFLYMAVRTLCTKKLFFQWRPLWRGAAIASLRPTGCADTSSGSGSMRCWKAVDQQSSTIMISHFFGKVLITTLCHFNRQLTRTHAADTRIVCHVQQSRFLSEIHSSEPQNIPGSETPFNCLFGSDFVEIANTASSAGTPAARLRCYKFVCVLWLAKHRNEQDRRPVRRQLWLGERLVQTGACREAQFA